MITCPQRDITEKCKITYHVWIYEYEWSNDKSRALEYQKPCGTPDLTGKHVEQHLLRTTLWKRQDNWPKLFRVTAGGGKFLKDLFSWPDRGDYSISQGSLSSSGVLRPQNLSNLVLCGDFNPEIFDQWRKLDDVLFSDGSKAFSATSWSNGMLRQEGCC